MLASRRTLLRRSAATGVAVLCLSLGQAALAANPQVRFKTSQGDFVVELYPDKAPQTVENFLAYVREGFYDGTLFHRVIAGFMVQGGGFDTTYRQKPTRDPIAHEGRKALAAGLHNRRGSLAMARTGDPHSATAQFFINVVDNERLDPVPIPDGDPVAQFTHMGRTYRNVPRADLENNPQLYGYTVFGQVVSGLDTIDRIRDVPTGAAGPFRSDAPRQAVVIESARTITD
ncbi:MAG: peptidylprolyl isomerase [Ottowia sp.]|nr:peptidylprolyl isomerase [Ottowia sp.]